MKKYFLILLATLVIYACKDNVVKKPDRLLSEAEMTEILYDLSILGAIQSNYPAKLKGLGIDGFDYIYDKYNIDSLQLAQNNVYYATDVKKYKRMIGVVQERLTHNKTEIDSSLIKKKPKKELKIKIDTVLEPKKSKQVVEGVQLQ